ncbi:MAG: MaoC family dehydratase N-terminal domain-containing protein [Actinobacteria bacterium]|nr:MaoC family dehydratase N-terminal domain-containing protein [Actinomycetota bacterium]MCB9411979.1 MaoC family dehydratase N-terminal domain-containing protein [Actinomycetota bacterium]
MNPPGGTSIDPSSLAIGDIVAHAEFRVRRIDLVKYAGASGDFNPIHWNERTATSVGLPDVIAHGMFTMAQAGRAVTDWIGDPGRLEQFTVRFSSPVVVADDDSGAGVEVTVRVAELLDSGDRVRLDITAHSEGSEVLGHASAVARLR